jgi:hypothetical protein
MVGSRWDFCSLHSRIITLVWTSQGAAAGHISRKVHQTQEGPRRVFEGLILEFILTREITLAIRCRGRSPHAAHNGNLSLD